MEINFGFGYAGLCLALAWYFVQKLKSDHPRPSMCLNVP